MSIPRQHSSSDHTDGHAVRQVSVSAANMPHLANVESYVAADAAKAADAERNMTLMQGLKLYPKAVGWSVLLSTCIIMEGFDLVLITSLYALPAFQKKFGTRISDDAYEVSAAWQAGISNGALIGEILGLLFVGSCAERIGYRKTLIGALVAVTCFIFITFFAQNLPMLLAGEILCGIPWGAFQTLTTTYAAEVCPVALRAYLTTYVNLCWVIGQFLASGVLKGVDTKMGSIAYKLPFGLQWIWPLPLIIGISLAPESPWWLMRKGRKDETRRQLLRLTSRDPSTFDVEETVNMMHYTIELERANTEGASYWDCFKGVDLRRTEIVCIVWLSQIWSGSALTNYSTYFYEKAGLDTSNAFSFSLATNGLGAAGTLLSWILMIMAGRRTLYLWGQITMFVVLLAAGLLSFARSADANWGIGGLIMVYTFVYDATVGPVTYSLVAELSSTRLRTKTVVLARAFYNLSNIFSNAVTPRMLNETAWNWGAKSAFFWAGTGLVCAVWTFFRLPEPKGRTFSELDVLFETRVSARKFRTTDVSAFAVEPIVADEKTALGSEQATHVEEAVGSLATMPC